MIELLRCVLALDSLRNYLTFYERMQIHKMIIQRMRIPLEERTEIVPKDLAPKIAKAIALIRKHQWKRPVCRYNEGRLTLSYYDDLLDQWLPIDYYEHEIINQIKAIKENGFK